MFMVSVITLEAVDFPPRLYKIEQQDCLKSGFWLKNQDIRRGLLFFFIAKRKVTKEKLVA
jgi:hypothetical protein